MSHRSQSEFEIIDRYFAESGLSFDRPGVKLGIGDDAAMLQVPEDKLLAMSMDVLVENVHFPAAADPGLLSAKEREALSGSVEAIVQKNACSLEDLMVQARHALAGRAATVSA